MCGAQVTWQRRNAHPCQIKAVGVPASLNSRFGLGVAVAVKSHRFAQVLELPGIQFGEGARLTQAQRKVRGTRAVLGVAPIVEPLAVVEKREPGGDAGVHVRSFFVPSSE